MPKVVELLHFIDVVICSLMLYSTAKNQIYFSRRKIKIYQIGFQLWMQTLWGRNKKMCWCYWRLPSHHQPPNFSWKWEQPWFFFLSLHDIWNQCLGCLWIWLTIYFFWCDCTRKMQWPKVAFERNSIFDQVAAFNTGFLSVWRCSIHIFWCKLIPIVGSQRDDRTQDAFNFFLSQLRIRKEMKFGLLQTKWCVLKNNL